MDRFLAVHDGLLQRLGSVVQHLAGQLDLAPSDAQQGRGLGAGAGGKRGWLNPNFLLPCVNRRKATPCFPSHPRTLFPRLPRIHRLNAAQNIRVRDVPAVALGADGEVEVSTLRASRYLDFKSEKPQKEGRISLNDLHKMAGGPVNQEPYRWTELEGTKPLVQVLQDQHVKTTEKNGGLEVLKADGEEVVLGDIAPSAFTQLDVE